MSGKLAEKLFQFSKAKEMDNDTHKERQQYYFLCLLAGHFINT